MGSFPTTIWSEVAKAGDANCKEGQVALNGILMRYLPALRSHLRFGRRLDAWLCDDVLQAFVAEKILEKKLIALASRDRGKFRTFLLVTLDRFMLNYVRSERSQSRKVQAVEDLEGLRIEDTSDPAPSVAFDVTWARQLLSETLAAMEEYCTAKECLQIWEVFKARTLLPILEDRPPVPYSELVERLHFQSPSQTSNALITANRMFIRLLRETIGKYAGSAGEIDQEIQDLRKILSTAGAGFIGLDV